MATKSLKGMYDILPKDAEEWRALEERFHHLVSTYGYRELRTPILELTELFARKGETSDTVTKQMYQFIDKGKRDICLKPEGTAPAIRAYLEHQLGGQGDVTRLWYFTEIFRYEQPQLGRNRQGHQLGLELIGSRSPLADAEIIALTYRFYESIGIRGKELRVNSIGNNASRSAYRQRLLEFAAPYLKTLSQEEREKAEQNPLRLLDSKAPDALEFFASAPSILDELDTESREHLERVRKQLDREQIPYTVDPKIVRGLDYYNDTVFEIVGTSLGAQSSLCGGGRYDNLVKELGGPPTACVGVGMGIERALIALSAEGIRLAQPNAGAFLVAAQDTAWDAVADLASMLRAEGISAVYDLDHSSLKRQMKLADKSGYPIALIIGEAELENQTVTAKVLSTGEQSTQTRQELTTWLSAFRPS